jgi:glycyl-tRNA synthetase (class II)
LEDLIEPLRDEPTLAVVRAGVGAVLDNPMRHRHVIDQEKRADLGVVDVLDVDAEVRIRGPRRPGRERKVDVNDEHAKDAPKEVVPAWKTVSTEGTERDQVHAPEVTEPAEGVERVDLAVVVAVPEVDVLLKHRLALDLLSVAPVRRAVRALLGRRVVRVRQP